MKKSNLLPLVATILFSLFFVSSFAQISPKDSRMSAEDGAFLFSGPKSQPLKTVNAKAEKNFQTSYRHTSAAEWASLNDKSLMCRFYRDNILHRAFYTPSGNWKYTVSGYEGGRLNKEVSSEIKSVYYDSRIVFVNQIDMVDGKIIYIVEIQDEKSIRKIRVDGDEMEVVQEFEKQ
jgi:hypothetical protein